MVLCNETVIPTVETDSGDDSEMGSVMEGEENKNQGLVSVPGSPRLQGHRGEQQRDDNYVVFGFSWWSTTLAQWEKRHLTCGQETSGLMAV